MAAAFEGSAEAQAGGPTPSQWTYTGMLFIVCDPALFPVLMLPATAVEVFRTSPQRAFQRAPVSVAEGRPGDSITHSIGGARATQCGSANCRGRGGDPAQGSDEREGDGRDAQGERGKHGVNVRLFGHELFYHTKIPIRKCF